MSAPIWLAEMRQANAADGHSRDEVAALLNLTEALAAALEGFAYVGAEQHLDRGHYYGCHYAVNGKRCAPHCAATRQALAAYRAGPRTE